MESIDALAKAVQEFKGGLVLVSHDMRLISQVADQIWICDDKTISKYHGDILSFKMDMRREMGIDEAVKLQGDASVKKKAEDALPPKREKEEEPKLEVIKPARTKALDDGTVATATSVTSSAGSLENTSSDEPPKNRYVPPHLRRKMASS